MGFSSLRQKQKPSCFLCNSTSVTAIVLTNRVCGEEVSVPVLMPLYICSCDEWYKSRDLLPMSCVSSALLLTWWGAKREVGGHNPTFYGGRRDTHWSLTSTLVWLLASKMCTTCVQNCAEIQLVRLNLLMGVCRRTECFHPAQTLHWLHFWTGDPVDWLYCPICDSVCIGHWPLCHLVHPSLPSQELHCSQQYWYKTSKPPLMNYTYELA